MIAAPMLGDWIGLPPDGDQLRLILVRHGEVDESAQGRCCGTLDPELSPKGRRQMQWTRQHLGALPAATFYSSPRRRALESARAIAHDAPVVIDERLSEINFGRLEGLTYHEVAERYPDVWRMWMARPTEVAFPDGECFTSFCARVDKAIADLRERHRGQTVITVAHGGVIRVVLARALGLDLQFMFRLQQTCGGVSVIDFYDVAVVVHVINAAGEV